MLYAIILLPLLLGLFCAFSKKDHLWVMLTVQAATVVLILYAIVCGGSYTTNVWQLTDSLMFSLTMDPLARFFCLLTSGAWMLTILYASEYMHHEINHPRFYAFLFLTEAAVLGTALAADFMTIYLFYEMTTLVSMPLVIHTQTPKAIMGATKYLYYSVGGAFAALLGITLLYANSGTLTFQQGGVGMAITPALLVAIFLIILGFATKAGMYPLHNWLPYAHPVAPAPAHALLSGIITKAGVVVVIRLIFFYVGADALRGTWVQWTCIILSLITIAMGSFMGCMERGLKKRLAYSSISQISYVLLGVFLLTPVGMLGALLQMFFHAAAKIGIFQCAGAIIYLTDTETVDSFRGLGRRIPVTMICFVMVSMSLVGIPPFGGFHSKWYLGVAALESLPGALAYIAPAVLIVSAFLTAGYLFAPIIAAFFPGKNFSGVNVERVHEPPAMMVSLILFSVISLLVGAMPNGVIDGLGLVARAIVQ